MRSLETTDLRQAIAREIEPTMFQGFDHDFSRWNLTNDRWYVFGRFAPTYATRVAKCYDQADAILALIRDRLLSEEAVEAGYDATRLPDGTPQFADAGFCLGHAAKILLAAMDRIEATQPVSGEVADG